MHSLCIASIQHLDYFAQFTQTATDHIFQSLKLSLSKTFLISHLQIFPLYVFTFIFSISIIFSDYPYPLISRTSPSSAFILSIFLIFQFSSIFLCFQSSFIKLPFSKLFFCLIDTRFECKTLPRFWAVRAIL